MDGDRPQIAIPEIRRCEAQYQRKKDGTVELTQPFGGRCHFCGEPIVLVGGPFGMVAPCPVLSAAEGAAGRPGG